MANCFKIGLISDTHGYFDACVETLFEGVDRIIHAGDIGSFEILPRLENIAPVTAVLGNTDYGLEIPLNKAERFGGTRIYVEHIVSPGALTPQQKTRFMDNRPDIVIFGHTHCAFDRTIDGIRYVNPGFAGSPKKQQTRSLAIVEIEKESLRVKFEKI